MLLLTDKPPDCLEVLNRSGVHVCEVLEQLDDIDVSQLVKHLANFYDEHRVSAYDRVSCKGRAACGLDTANDLLTGVTCLLRCLIVLWRYLRSKTSKLSCGMNWCGVHKSNL